jgi:hypothetical protein
VTELPVYVFADGQEAATLWLGDQLPSRWAADVNAPVTVAVDLPEDWTPESDEHVLVAWDATPGGDGLLLAFQTIRLVAYAATTGRAKRLCALAQGVLLAHPGFGGVCGVTFLTGVQPGEDPSTGGEIAASTVRMEMRSTLA